MPYEFCNGWRGGEGEGRRGRGWRNDEGYSIITSIESTKYGHRTYYAIYESTKLVGVILDFGSYFLDHLEIEAL